LICRSEATTTTAPQEEALDQMLIAANIHPGSKKTDLKGDGVEKFIGPKGETVQINHPLTKAALLHLSKTWPRRHRFDEIVREARGALGQASGSNVEVREEDVRDLHGILFRMFGTGMLDFHMHEPSYCDRITNKPIASPLARWQAAHGTEISNLRHEGLRIKDPLALKLIQLLDGTRDEKQLFKDLLAYIQSPQFRVTHQQRSRVAAQLSVHLKQNLRGIAKDGLLIA